MIKLSAFLLLILISVGFTRVEILTWALKRYAKQNEQLLQFKITTFNFEELTFKNIQLNEKNRIPLFSVKYHLWSTDLRKIKLDIETLDAESLQETFSRLSSKNSEPKEPLDFKEANALCVKVQKLDLNVHWRELVVGRQTIPLQLKAENSTGETAISWDDQKNSKGRVQIVCHSDLIKVVSSQLNFELRDTEFKETKITDFSIQLHDTSVQWKASQPLEWLTRGAMTAHFTQAMHSYIMQLPTLELAGLYNFDGSISGNLKMPNISLGFQKPGDQIAGLNLTGTFTKTTQQTEALLRLRDSTGEIFLDDFRITHSEEFLQIKTEALKTKFKFNDQLVNLIPDVKKWLTSLTGTLSIGSDLTFKNETWSGWLHVIGENLSSQSDYGDYEGVSFNHKVTSLKALSTPPGQSLKIKKINLGPGVEDLSIVYQMPNVATIDVSKFTARAGKGEIYAENFTIYPLKKRIEKFIAQVINLDLETLLAIGLKDTVKAQGVLHGHLGVNFIGTRPVFRGLLTDPKPGWIQYRTGNTQAPGISLSDGPMEILNNYLYDYQYQNLSLTITSDTNYDMKMTLAALGHNPNYLNGKPLKLNVNLEQNLLAAMQSIMLTYDLPNRIREKFEKVTE
jgi:hypothetical protein